jgi:predicted Zn-dependent protease
MRFDRHFPARSIPATLLALALMFACALPLRAQGLLRDADIEHGLRQLAAPILRAAGLNPSRVPILVVDDGSMNAFIISNDAIFIHYGMIFALDEPGMLQAVIAHEAAHIANGHIARRTANMRSARTMAGLGMALAAAAAAGGAAGDAVAGIAMGTQSSALRGFLKHTRAEESAADRSAARFMIDAGISPTGLLKVHRLFRGQEALSEVRQDPYMRSHPLSSDRVRAAEAFVAAHGDRGAPTAEAVYWHARVRGKLSAFIRSPKWTMSRADEEAHADIRLMREAIAWHRRSDAAKAIRAIDAAIAARGGRDPFYYDLKGQILLESRQFGAAVAAYQTAVSLGGNDAQILGGLGRAQLAAGQPKAALATLEAARTRDFGDARVLRDLGQAYAQTGQTGMASVAVAERYALLGRLDDAGIHAERAMGLLPRGSVGWRRAEDVFIAYEQDKKRRR